MSAPVSQQDRRCEFCGSLQPAAPQVSTAQVRAVVRNVLEEDRLRAAAPSPQKTSSPWLVGSLAAGVLVMSAVVAAFALSSREPELDPAPPVTSEAPLPVPEPTPPPVVPPPEPVIPDGPTVVFTEEKPKPKIVRPKTNDEWAQRIVATKRVELKECLEQELNRRPDVPKAYEVKVSLDDDAQSIFADLRLGSGASESLRQCVAFKLRWGFQNAAERSNRPPQACPCVVTASFAFPDAKPAAKADDRFGY